MGSLRMAPLPLYPPPSRSDPSPSSRRAQASAPAKAPTPEAPAAAPAIDFGSLLERLQVKQQQKAAEQKALKAAAAAASSAAAASAPTREGISSDGPAIAVAAGAGPPGAGDVQLVSLAEGGACRRHASSDPPLSPFASPRPASPAPPPPASPRPYASPRPAPAGLLGNLLGPDAMLDEAGGVGREDSSDDDDLQILEDDRTPGQVGSGGDPSPLLEGVSVSRRKSRAPALSPAYLGAAEGRRPSAPVLPIVVSELLDGRKGDEARPGWGRSDGRDEK